MPNAPTVKRLPAALVLDREALDCQKGFCSGGIGPNAFADEVRSSSYQLEGALRTLERPARVGNDYGNDRRPA
ncbi:MAG: hypothetical protein HY900_05185 [Deltaproteobacteria bacterium]|nr:hypothetical protein [Deltaproteobacteria bacterium]